MSDSEAEKEDECLGDLLAQGHDVEISELDKSGNVQRRWLHTHDHFLIPISQYKSNGFFSRSLREWRKLLSDAFLPVGFPHSVSDDYLAYQTYDSLQAFFSTITALLANRALLQGLGVGDANSSATFALLLTILKDAMSRIATIVFAHRFGLRIEPDAKRYRFLADLFNDTAFFLELYSPYLGSWGKVAALSAGEALRALCGVAAGASKAALSVHFAKHDNLAELNAKEASQETAVGLVGLLFGTFVVKYIEDHQSVVLLTVLLVFAHLWMNYLGVRSVCMDTFNRQRATIMFEEYLKSGQVLSPRQVAARESIIFWSPFVHSVTGQRIARIEFADSYTRSLGNSPPGHVHIIDRSAYVMFLSQGPGQLQQINVLLSIRAIPKDAIHAWFNAMEIAWFWEKRLSPFDHAGGSSASAIGAIGVREKDPLRFNDPELWDMISAKGWDLTSQAFETGAPVRLSFSKERKDE